MARQFVFWVAFAFAMINGFSCRAEIWCQENPDGSWSCWGTGIGGGGGGSVTTNELGQCTNCVRISVAELQAFKGESIGILDEVSETLDAMLTSYQNGMELLDQLVNEANSWSDNDYDTASIWDAINKPQGYYSENVTYAGVGSWDSIGDVTARELGTANNALYFYGQDTLIPILSDAKWSFEGIYWGVEECKPKVSGLKTTIQNLSEEPCNAHYGDGEGGQGGGGGGGALTCQCKEQLEELLKVCKRIDNGVDQSRIHLEGILSTLDIVGNNVSNLTEIATRLDSWVTEDFSPMMVSITNTIAGAILTCAEMLVAADGYEKTDLRPYALDPMEAVSTNFLEVGEYKNLNWFSRIEALLLYGFHPWRGSGGADTDVDGESIQNAIDGSDAIISKATQANGDVESIEASFSRAWSSLQNALSTGGVPADGCTVTIFDDWLGGEGLSFKIPPEYIELCRTVTTILWLGAVVAISIAFVVWIGGIYALVGKWCIWLVLKMAGN